jgi:hypothetical protein
MMGKTLILIVGGLALLAFIPEIALACEHCYGAAGDNEVTRGIGVAMGALIGATGFIGVGTFAFFRKMTVRARLLEAGDLEVTLYGELVSKDI